MRFVNLHLLMLALCCSCSHNSGDSAGGENSVQNKESVYENNVFKCESSQALEKTRFCLSDHSRALNLSERISGWKPDQGSWLSLQLQSKNLVKLYNLSAAETSCLKKTFCQEKIQ